MNALGRRTNRLPRAVVIFNRFPAEKGAEVTAQCVLAHAVVESDDRFPPSATVETSSTIDHTTVASVADVRSHRLIGRDWPVAEWRVWAIEKRKRTFIVRDRMSKIESDIYRPLQIAAADLAVGRNSLFPPNETVSVHHII
jgi:hypothetical protein